MEKPVKVSGTTWTAVRVLRKFVVKMLYNIYNPKLITHLHKDGETDLYKLATIADRYTTARNLVAG